VSVNGADWAAGGGGIQSFFARAQYDYKKILTCCYNAS
jgi:hypothetical protein